jgi:hypothetical protein
MLNEQTVDINILLFLENYNGTLGMTIDHGDQTVTVPSCISDSEIQINFTMTPPCDIVINTFNKQICDTELLSDGKIGRDKHIKILKLVVDKLEVPDHILYKILRQETETAGIVNGPYFGHNSKCFISFDTANTLKWHLRQLLY